MPAEKKLRRGSSPTLRRRLLLSTALTGVVLAAASQPSGAATLTVTNTNDSGAGSLRAAITGSNPGDTINVSSGLTGTIALISDLPPVNGVTIDLTAGSVSIAGTIAASFTGGSSSLNSQPANTYSGATSLTGGTLSVIGTGGFSAPQSQLGMSVGTIFNATTTPTGSVAPGATFASLSGAGTINLTGGSGNGLDLTGNDQLTTTFNGKITGTGGELALFGGGGTLILSGTTNDYSGPTDIFGNVIVGTPGGGPQGATLKAGAANAFSPNSAVVMSGGVASTLDLNNFNQTIASLSGSGTVKLGSALLSLGADNTSTTFSGSITGTGGLDKFGTGTFTLGQSGGAIYSGSTLIDAGVFQAGANNAFSPNSPVAIAPGARLDVNGTTQTIAGLAGAGSVTLGNVEGLLSVNTASSTAYSGVISGSGGLIKSGTGTLTLSGANTFSGNTGVNGGTLQAGAGNSFSPNSAVGISPGATLDLNGFNQTIAGLNGAGSVKLGSGMLTDNTSSLDGYAGVMSGSGSLTKGGSGTLVLTGVNTYTGVTTISGGTLTLSVNGSIASSAQVALNGGTFDVSNVNSITAVQTLTSNLGTTVNVGSKTLIFGGSTPQAGGIPDAFFGSFTGTGGLIYNGADTALLGGDNSRFTGTLLITAGTVSIGGDLGGGVSFAGAPFGGNVTINPGGTLAGMGVIKGTVNNIGGFVRPGGSIGTLTVGGNYTQSASATLAIEVSPTASSKLVVGGAASLAGTLKLMFDPGVYTPNATYNFLSASSVSGTFDTVTSDNALIGPNLVYGANGITAQLTRVAPTNATAFLNVTSQLVLNGQRANAMILDRVGNRASGVADGEVAQAGASVTGLQLAQADNAATVGNFLSTLPQAVVAQGAWFRGVGDFASVDSSGAVPGFTGSAGGFLAGYDWPVAADTYLGVAGGYLHSTVTESGTGSTGAADTARFAVYGGTFLGPSLFTGTIGYAHDWIDTSRPIAGIGTAIENHGGNEATVAGQWSLPLQVQGLGQGVATLTPKIGLQFLHLGEDSFNESSAGGFNLASGGRGTDSLQPFVAFAAAQKFVTADGTFITPEVRFGYDREALSGARTLTVATVSGAQFPVTGIKPSKDIVTAGAGITVDAGPNLALYATYDGIVPIGNTTDHTVQAGLRMKF